MRVNGRRLWVRLLPQTLCDGERLDAEALPPILTDGIIIPYYGRKVENVDLNIKNKEAYRLTKQLSKLTGESLTTAVTEAVRERLDRVRRERGVDLAERLLAIGRDCAARLKEPFRTIDHDAMLYDERGLPK